MTADMVEFDPARIESPDDFSAALRRLRAEAGLTVRQVAAATGTCTSTLSGYYSGKHLPQVNPPTVLRDILLACGVTEQAVDRWRAALLRVRRRPGRPAVGAPTPYRGLARYEPEHTDWFHGREPLVRAILAKLTDRSAHRGPLFVIGPSGSGKSSLLRAGVLPALGQPWILMTPGARPILELAQHLADGVGIAVDELEGMLRDDPVAAAMAIRTRYDGPGLLVVDQFEELFTMCDREGERALFAAALAALATSADDDAHRFHVVLGMRDDFYPAATHHSQLAESLQDGQILVGPMTEDELRKAIVAPAARAGLRMEPGLVELLVRDVTSTFDTSGAHDIGALPLLSHALLMTWERRERSTLTVASYHDSGGIGGAISTTADRVYLSLDQDDRELARIVFRRLVHHDDSTPTTRRRVQLDELRIAGSADGVDRVIREFVAHRLLTSGADGIEITHEALIGAWPRLRKWLDTDRASAGVRRQLTAASAIWHQAGCEPTALYRGALLDTAQAWADDPAHARELNELERSFLDASREQRAVQDRAARLRGRRRYVLIAALATLVLLASVLSSYVVAQHNVAARAHDDNESVQLAEQAARFHTSDVSLSAQLALAAYRIAPTPQARASLFDATSGPTETRMLGPDRVLQAVAVTPNGRLLATGGTDDHIHLWSLADRNRPRQVAPPVAGPTDTVYSVAFSPDGQMLAAAGADRVVRLWDVRNPAHPKLLGRPITGPTNTVYSIAFSPDGRVLAAGSADDMIRLWNIADLARPVPFRPVTGFGDYVQSVTFSHDGRLLAAGGADQTVRLWNVTDPAHPTALGTPLTGPAGKVFSVTFSPDDRLLAEGGADQLVRLWNIADPGHPVAMGAPLAGATGWVNSVAFNSAGTMLAVASSDNTVRLWDVATGQVVETLPHPGPVTAAMFLDGDHDVATSDADGTTRLWSIPGGLIDDRADTVFSLSYPAAGNLLAVSAGARADTIELWNTRDARHPVLAGPPIAGPAGPSEFAGSLGVSPDGHTLAAGNRDGSIELWDISDPRHPALLGRPPTVASALIESLEFSADGKLLATGGDDGLVRLWDVRNRARPRLLATLSGPANYVYGVAFSADDRLLAAASADDKVWLWRVADPAAPVRLRPLTGFSSYVVGVAFAPHGRLLAAGSADKTVRLWDLSDPERPASLGPPLTGATNYVYSVAFSPDGRTLAAGSTDHTVQLWNVSQPARPALLGSLTAATDSVFVVAFAPDGSTLAAGTAAKEVRLWTIDPASAARSVCAWVGDPITPREWALYLPDRPYQPPC
ncbi:MAG TPA: helix-turn-helix domain-containing protein [Pseudonocardiaceae bacterium]|nr:helix-turn-helix domain-containing protein [Pseudonocardiaceae bacterium]